MKPTFTVFSSQSNTVPFSVFSLQNNIIQRIMQEPECSVVVGDHTHGDLIDVNSVYTKEELDAMLLDLDPIYINTGEDIDGGNF